ncbi:MAG: peptide ABC transporter substrate-binding protein [Deltaproteobacteria bacterium]|nr:peptide ABC transporter substrate-binding protein [Deltaproteobacteria bacterium]
MLGTEPPQLNSTRSTDQESIFLLGHLMEGLTRYGKNSEIIPGIAERWEINDQGATFYLRHNALWADGKPVTAHDFVFAWRLVVDPANASEYAFIMYPVKNAEGINTGKLKKDTLAVTAVDDYTLKIEFEKPCGYFLGLTAFATYLPVRQDFYKAHADRFAADPQDIISNGPFILTRWIHGAELTLSKNPRYWRAQQIKLDRIEVPYITTDLGARYNLFRDGKVDTLGIGREQIDRALADRLRMQSHDDGAIFYIEFNHRPNRPTANLHLRRALRAIINTSEYVSRVVAIPGSRPGNGLIPQWVPGIKNRFREEFPLASHTQNIELAKNELELAKNELGGSIPPLYWLTDDGPGTARNTEYFQNIFKNHLGIDIFIDKQIFKERLAKSREGKFDIVSSGWGPDFADPMTYVELFTSWNANNNGKYSDPKYDAFIRQAQATADQQTRMQAMAQAEQIALADVAIIPLFERTVIWAHQPWVHGIVRHVIGPDPDFAFVTISKKN